MEQLAVQMKTQEDSSDKHIENLREEIDKIEIRINEKDKVIFNTVKQVCEMDYRVTENRAFNLESRKKVMANKKYLMVLQPLRSMKMMMSMMKEVTMGSQFNKMVDHMDALQQRLQNEFDHYDDEEQIEILF